MSEEKKLDEKALEEVSGGWSVVEIPKFEANNCVSCGHYFNHTCPYGGPDKALAYAIKEIGKEARCPERVLRNGP